MRSDEILFLVSPSLVRQHHKPGTPKVMLCLVYTPELSHSSWNMSVVQGWLGLEKFHPWAAPLPALLQKPQPSQNLLSFPMNLFLGPSMTFLSVAFNHIIPKRNTEPQMSLFSFPEDFWFYGCIATCLPRLSTVYQERLGEVVSWGFEGPYKPSPGKQMANMCLYDKIYGYL